MSNEDILNRWLDWLKQRDPGYVPSIANEMPDNLREAFDELIRLSTKDLLPLLCIENKARHLIKKFDENEPPNGYIEELRLALVSLDIARQG